MANIIALQDLQYFDYDSAVDEVEILVPKYLEVLKDLEGAATFEDMVYHIQNVITYWSRLAFLLGQIQDLEGDAGMEEAMMTSLQSELSVLEKAYLKVNKRMNYCESHWTDAMWRAADLVLSRMDQVLEELDFDQSHEDRVLICELIQNNYIKKSRASASSRET